MTRKTFFLISLIAVISMILAACGGGTPQPPTGGTGKAAPTEAPTAGPTEAPTTGPAHTTCEGTNDSFSPALTYNVADGKNKTYKWTTTANVKVTCNNGQPKFEVIAIAPDATEAPATQAPANTAPIGNDYTPGAGLPLGKVPDKAPISLEDPIATPAYKSGKCPSDKAVAQALDPDGTLGLKPVFSGYDADPCKWQLQAVSPFVFENVTFPEYYQLTATLADETVAVYYGDGKQRDIKGATVAYLPAYPKNHWRWNADELMAHEFHFGFIRDPWYITVNGNTSAMNWLGYTGATCPTTTTQVAGLVGGNSFNWTEPDWSRGAWKYHSDTYYELYSPFVETYNSWVDYYNSQKGAADKILPFHTIGLIDASFHCEPIK